MNDLKNITYLEQKLGLCTNLVEIAKTYCDFNYDKAEELPVLGSMLEIILNNQKELSNTIDNMQRG